MKANEASFLAFLNGTKQFIIPIYQRTYSWTTQQCQQLWDDLVRVAANPQTAGHFLGSIVYIYQGNRPVTQVQQLLVIDGQQRLTTLSLLLAALGRAMETRQLDGGTTQAKIENYYLRNNQERGEDQYKLLLTESDRMTLIRILDGHEPPTTVSRPVQASYDFFRAKLAEPGVDVEALYQAIGKLTIVDIMLDQGRDDPQLIFDSLNSTGLDLSQADRIRNYILMGLPPDAQTTLYTRFWHPMEERFAPSDPALFDNFMRDYLTLRTGRIPNIREIYSSFKTFALEQRHLGQPVAALVEEIYHYAKLYVKLARLEETDLQIQAALGDLQELRLEVAYPFLLDVYSDYEAGRLDQPTFVAVLRLLESYVFRRAICWLPTNVLSRMFPTILRQIDKTRYLESLQDALLERTGRSRFPLDEEFQRDFQSRDVYHSTRIKWVLGRLTNFDTRELVSIKRPDITVEHILPQNPDLSPAWRAMLGEQWKAVQDLYLHTIGNLTLTGYNSELSARPFLEKRDHPRGFAMSQIHLNQPLAALDHWDAETIQQRAAALAALAVQVWPVPMARAQELAERRRTRVPSSPAGAGTRWTEATFFPTLESQVGADATGAVQAILAWATARSLRIWWGKGSQQGVFYPMMDHPRQQYTVSVWTDGSIKVQFQYLQPPFDTLAMREMLRLRLNAIPGVAIAANRVKGRPPLPLTALTDPSALLQFLATLDWILDETVAAASGFSDAESPAPSPGDEENSSPGVHPPGEGDTPRHLLRRRFWEQLLPRALAVGVRTHAGRSSTKDYWLGASAGRPGFILNYLVLQEQTAVQLEIRTPDTTANKRFFDALFTQQATLEAAFGAPFEWRRMDDKISCQINYVVADGGVRSPESDWPSIQDALIAAMQRLDAVFRERIQKLS